MRLKLQWMMFAVLFLMVSTPVTSAITYNSTLDQNELQNPITGFKRPQLDGIITPLGSSNLKLGEWDDAQLSSIDLIQSENEVLNVKHYQKVVNHELFVGLLLPANIDPSALSRIGLMIDRDISTDISKGDVLLNFEFVPTSTQKSQVSNTEILIALLEAKVYDGQNWNLFDERDKYDIPESQRWAKLVATKNDLHNDFSINIEISINPMVIDKHLVQFPPAPQDSTDGILDVNYNFVLQTNVGSYGFPNAPIFTDEDESIVPSYTEIYYDAPTLIPTKVADVGISHIEMTQSTQTEDNDYSLVKGKTSLARVFVDHDQSGLLEVEVTLTVTRLTNYNGDLIAYTIYTHTLQFFAPENPRRVHTGHSANFALGSSITNTSTIIVEATVEVVGDYYDPYSGNNVFEDVFFTEKVHPMNVYVVPINNNTWSSPILPTEGHIFSLQNYMEMLFPIPSINYIRMDWTDLGTISRTILGDIVGEFDGLLLNLQLNDLYMSMLSQRRTSVTPMAFPHQLHGIGPFAGLFGGGLSFPEWGIPPGNGRVAWSANWGSTMAHEVVHNLGPGTWGRHVTGYGYGCGAPDGLFSKDNDWDSLYGDNIIHDLGWNFRDGLIHGTTPELMTYCRADGSPTRWIGGYRWERLLTRLQEYTRPPVTATSPSLAIDSVIPQQDVQSTFRQIRGVITQSGQGVLLPSFEQPGYVNDSKQVTKTDSEILLRVHYNDQSSTDIPIAVGFDNLEDEPHEYSLISETLSDDGTIMYVELINSTSNTVLDQLNAKHSSIDLNVNFPKEIIRNEHGTISWEFGGTNTSNLYTKAMYTPDGSTWLPLGSMTKGNTLDFKISSYPGGADANIGLLVSDGIYTEFVVAPMFNIAHKTPELRFLDTNPVVEHFDEQSGNVTGFSLLPARMNTTVGSTLPVKVHSQSELGYEIPYGYYDWTLYTEDQTEIASHSGMGSEFRFQFTRAGNYTLDVKVTDPNTGLTSSKSMFVEILPHISKTTVNDYQTFTQALEQARETFGSPSDASKYTAIATVTVTEGSGSNESSLPIFFTPVILTVVILTYRSRLSHRKT